MEHYQPGDLLSRRKGLVMHKGIALEDGRVLHNSPFRGERVDSLDGFLRGRRLKVTHLPPGERERALRSAGELPRRDYRLFTNNCEHTVSRATKGRASSPQLRSWALGIGIAAVAFAVTRHPAAAAAGFALGRRLLRPRN